MFIRGEFGMSSGGADNKQQKSEILDLVANTPQPSPYPHLYSGVTPELGNEQKEIVFFILVGPLSRVMRGHLMCHKEERKVSSFSHP